MEPNMLVLVVGPEDLRAFDLRQPGDEPKFGIVWRTLNQSGRYQEFLCQVGYDGGTSAVLRVGQLVPLIVLSEEDAASLGPKAAFAKWAPEIVRRHLFLRLPEAQRRFLMEVPTRRRRK